MYHDYFGISESPFSITPDPRYLYMSKGHHEALAHLLYGVSENGGFVLLTGEVGTGKTSVCRCLLEQLPAKAEVALILNPRLNELELLAGICDELDIAYPKDTTSLKVMVDVLNDHLLEIHANGRHAVVVIDEAQNLSRAVMEQVRLLTNLETATRKLLQIILIGQPELAEILTRTDMRQLAQRVTAHYHLDPLGPLETPGYIRYRLAVGGLSPEIFTARATAAVHKRSGGIPRIINSICDRCLLGAYAQDKKTIDHRLVQSASKEVFGKPGKKKKAVAKRWPVAAAVAAVMVLIFTPAVFGLFAMPLDWSSKVEGLLFTEPKTSKAPPAASAEVAVADEPEAATPSKSMPDTPPETKAAAMAPNTKPAAKPAIQTAQNSATQSKPATEAKPQTSFQDTVEAATYLSSDILVPAAAPEKPEQDKASSAQQVALAPAVNSSLDGANGSASLHTESPDSQVVDSVCREPSATARISSTDPGDLLSGSAAERGEQAGLAVLFSCWNVEFHRVDRTAPCTRSTNGGLECLKGQAGWTALAQINRPALITLADSDGRKGYAVVAGINGKNVTLLSAERRVEADVASLERFWTGEYLLLWRPPPLYYRLLARGARGEDVTWLNNRFAEQHGEPVSTEKIATFDSELHQRVVDFQIDRGLMADGIVGARTLIQINTATSVPGPPVLRAAEPSAVASE